MSEAAPQVYCLTDWIFVREMKAKVEAGETLTEQEVEMLRRIVDWLDAKQLEEEGFPEAWLS